MALWTPEYIDTALWLDAADSSTITESGGAVSAWADKSGNGRDAGQSDSGLQPLTSSNTLNSLNVITFSSNFLSFTLTAFRSIFFVCSSVGSSIETIIGNTGTEGDHVFLRTGQSYDISIDGSGSKTGNASVDGGAPVSGRDIDLSLSDAEIQGDRLFYADWGVDCNLNAVARFRGTSTYLLDGRIGEIVGMTYVPTDTQRQRIEGYLAHKWGLESNLPAGHPYETAAPLAPYNISGTITGADGNSAARIVRAYNRSTGALIGETTSDASTGFYDLGSGTDDEIQRIVLADEGATVYNDIIDRVIPG